DKGRQTAERRREGGTGSAEGGRSLKAVAPGRTGRSPLGDRVRSSPERADWHQTSRPPPHHTSASARRPSTSSRRRPNPWHLATWPAPAVIVSSAPPAAAGRPSTAVFQNARQVDGENSCSTRSIASAASRRSHSASQTGSASASEPKSCPPLRSR